MTLSECREEMSRRILLGERSADNGPTYTDAHLASSILQKSLRRSAHSYAKGAARSLSRLDPDRLWRRLAAIIIEDFGAADLELTRCVIAAASDGLWRDAVGGDELVADHLVTLMCRTPRDRAADEIYMWAAVLRPDAKPAESPAEMAASPKLQHLMIEATKLASRCEERSAGIGGPRYLPRQCDASLSTMCSRKIIGHDLYSLALQARRTSKTCLPVFWALWVACRPAGEAQAVQSITPGFEDIDGVPSYAVDGYTRSGRRALWELYRQNRALRGLMSGLNQPSIQHALTALAFEVEGGLLTQRIVDPLSSELLAQASGCWSGLSRQRFKDGALLMRGLLPRLNVIRRDILEAKL